MSLASFTKHLESLERDEESTIKKTKQQGQQMKHESHSLKSLITNDHLSQLWNLERLEALIVFEWIASSCIECEGLECLGEVNGGGWGCIYSPQPLPSRCFISANRGRSALLVRTVRPCTSTAEIATVSSNGYINGYNALNVSSDVR